MGRDPAVWKNNRFWLDCLVFFVNSFVCLCVVGSSAQVWGGRVCSSLWALCWRGWDMKGWWTSSRPSRCWGLRDLLWCRQRYSRLVPHKDTLLLPSQTYTYCWTEKMSKWYESFDLSEIMLFNIICIWMHAWHSSTSVLEREGAMQPMLLFWFPHMSFYTSWTLLSASTLRSASCVGSPPSRQQFSCSFFNLIESTV